MRRRQGFGVGPGDTGECEGAMMERQEGQSKEWDSVMILHNEKVKENKENSTLLPSHPAPQRNQISYRNKLLEKEEEVFSQELEDQMKEWLCEEKEISPPLTEEQKILLDSLPKLSMSDERLMGLCRPWKDALILSLLGKSTNLEMMKDRIAWILRSRSFELIDLPNNYFVFKTGNRDLRLRLLFDGPWVIQGHYLAVQRWSPNFNPYIQNLEEDSLEKSQPVVDISHASKNPSYCHAQLKPLVSVPRINSDEEFGSWMIAKRNSKKRIHNLEPKRKLGKMPESNKSNGKGKKSASGSRFDVLQEVQDHTSSKGVGRLRKTEVTTTTWRRKEGEALSSIKEGVIEPKKRIESRESESKEVVVGHIEKEKLNLGTDGKCTLVIGEPHLEPSTEIEMKEKATEVKEKEGKATNVLVGQSVILSQATDDYNLRPNGLSSVRNKKKAARAHNVIFGSTKTIESSKVSEMKEQVGGKKKNYEEKEIVPYNPGIVDSSMNISKNAKNDDVDRGEEDSEVVPSPLPLDELIEHIADDADFTEGQESLVAETQFELGQEPDAGHAR
ncbi:hypothetical protein K1719_018913 [Acacia pycnantha]|nr:hypothetical protein K1719_018913 [Acacia pycnantha]